MEAAGKGTNFKRIFKSKLSLQDMENEINLSDLREKHGAAGQRPKKLRFFWELNRQAQDTAVAEEQEQPERFDWDARGNFNRRFQDAACRARFPGNGSFLESRLLSGRWCGILRKRLS